MSITDWISVNEKLPPLETRVDIWVQELDACFRATDFEWTGFEWRNYYNEAPLKVEFPSIPGMIVTHWRPLPPAPPGYETGHGNQDAV